MEFFKQRKVWYLSSGVVIDKQRAIDETLYELLAHALERLEVPDALNLDHMFMEYRGCPGDLSPNDIVVCVCHSEFALRNLNKVAEKCTSVIVTGLLHEAVISTALREARTYVLATPDEVLSNERSFKRLLKLLQFRVEQERPLELGPSSPDGIAAGV